jgi:hypothetical protein
VNCNCIRRKWDPAANNNGPTYFSWLFFPGMLICNSAQLADARCWFQRSNFVKILSEDMVVGRSFVWYLIIKTTYSLPEIRSVLFSTQKYVIILLVASPLLMNTPFAAQDPAQTARVSLGKDYFAKRAIAEVSPPPDGERFVVQTKITDDRSHLWGFWGPSGPVVNRTNEAVEPWCLEANEFLFEFGPAHDLVGSMIYGLRVLAIEDSTPAGFIDSISRFEIVGWAFDPIAPQRVLDVEIFVDGTLLKKGSTGVDRPDIVASYGLPSSSKPGFNISVSLAGSPLRLLSIHTEWIGVFRRQTSEKVTFWTMQPAGQILDVSPSAVRGWAYLVDYPATCVKYVEEKTVFCILISFLFHPATTQWKSGRTGRKLRRA